MSLHQINRTLLPNVSQYVAVAGNSIAYLAGDYPIVITMSDQSFTIEKGDSGTFDAPFDGFHVRAAQGGNISLIVGFGDFRQAASGSIDITGNVRVINPRTAPVPVDLQDSAGEPIHVMVENAAADGVPVVPGSRGAAFPVTAPNALPVSPSGGGAFPVSPATGTRDFPVDIGGGRGETSAKPLFVEVTQGGSGFAFDDVVGGTYSSQGNGTFILYTFTRGGYLHNVPIMIGRPQGSYQANAQYEIYLGNRWPNPTRSITLYRRTLSSSGPTANATDAANISLPVLMSRGNCVYVKPSGLGSTTILTFALIVENFSADDLPGYQQALYQRGEW